MSQAILKNFGPKIYHFVMAWDQTNTQRFELIQKKLHKNKICSGFCLLTFKLKGMKFYFWKDVERGKKLELHLIISKKMKRS